MLFAHTEPINYWVLSLKIVPGPRAMRLWHVHNPSHPDAVFHCTDWWAGWLAGSPACRQPSPQYGSQLWSTLSSSRNSANSPPSGMTAAVRCTNSAHIGPTLLPCLCDSSAHKGVWVAKQKKSCRNNTPKKKKKKGWLYTIWRILFLLNCQN